MLSLRPRQDAPAPFTTVVQALKMLGLVIPSSFAKNRLHHGRVMIRLRLPVCFLLGSLSPGSLEMAQCKSSLVLRWPLCQEERPPWPHERSCIPPTCGLLGWGQVDSRKELRTFLAAHAAHKLNCRCKLHLPTACTRQPAQKVPGSATGCPSSKDGAGYLNAFIADALSTLLLLTVSAALTSQAGGLQVPTGVANFPKELFCAPKAWAASQYNLKQWSVLPAGGHFAALEEPELLAEDVRKFFAKYH